MFQTEGINEIEICGVKHTIYVIRHVCAVCTDFQRQICKSEFRVKKYFLFINTFIKTWLKIICHLLQIRWFWNDFCYNSDCFERKSIGLSSDFLQI